MATAKKMYHTYTRPHPHPLPHPHTPPHTRTHPHTPPHPPTHVFFVLSVILICTYHYAKQKNLSQSCRAHLVFGARLIQQNSSVPFFHPKYTLKDMTYTIKHTGQQTS